MSTGSLDVGAGNGLRTNARQANQKPRKASPECNRRKFSGSTPPAPAPASRHPPSHHPPLPCPHTPLSLSLSLRTRQPQLPPPHMYPLIARTQTLMHAGKEHIPHMHTLITHTHTHARRAREYHTHAHAHHACAHTHARRPRE